MEESGTFAVGGAETGDRNLGCRWGNIMGRGRNEAGFISREVK